MSSSQATPPADARLADVAPDQEVAPGQDVAPDQEVAPIEQLPADGEPASGWSGPPSERGHFRPDIEGLRAVAVLAVLLFHIGVPGFDGGFVGVDVFFVISGFLITGLLVREVSGSGTVNLVSFYARRLRRLMPAALIVVLVTLVVSAFVVSRLRFGDIAGDAIASALYVSNYRFAFGGLDYLTDNTLSPLLHYWSLGVEEQFYLFWPLMVLVAVRWFAMRRLVWVIAGVGLISLVTSFVLTDFAAPVAFFSLPTRAWELALGGVLALTGARLARLPRPVLLVAGWAGLALIIASAILVDPALPYPGTLALFPTIGAALVIAGGERLAGVSRWLATRPARWIGRISYSLYLWHWPMLILLPLAIGRDDLVTRLIIAVLAIAVAHASARWIEEPFRHRGPSRQSARRIVGLAVGSSVIVAGVGLGSAAVFQPPRPLVALHVPSSVADARTIDGTTFDQPLLSGRVPDTTESLLGVARDDLPSSYNDGCQLNTLGTTVSECVYGDPQSSTTVALFGDSHAAQWLPALQLIAADRGWRIVSFTKVSCPTVDILVWNRRLHRPYRECAAWRQGVLDRLAQEHPALIIAASARSYTIVDGAQRIDRENMNPAWQTGLTTMLAELHQVTPNVVYMADVPRNVADPIECMAVHAVVDTCQAMRAVALDAAYSAVELAAAAATSTLLISVNDTLCPGSVCPLIFGDYVVYRDTGHVTATFAKLLAPQIEEALPIASLP